MNAIKNYSVSIIKTFSTRRTLLLLIICIVLPGCGNNINNSPRYEAPILLTTGLVGNVSTPAQLNKAPKAVLPQKQASHAGIQNPQNSPNHKLLNVTAPIEYTDTDHHLDHDRHEEENVLAIKLPALVRICILLCLVLIMV